MKKPRRASLGIATALITTLVATTAQTTRAQADSALANITGFQTTNISLSSEGCKAVPVTMYVSTTDPSSFTSLLTTHIYRNGREVDYTWFSENKPDTWLWCSSNGFGTFRLGPSDGSVYTDSGTYAIHDSTVGYVKVEVDPVRDSDFSPPRLRVGERGVVRLQHQVVVRPHLRPVGWGEGRAAVPDAQLEVLEERHGRVRERDRGDHAQGLRAHRAVLAAGLAGERLRLGLRIGAGVPLTKRDGWRHITTRYAGSSQVRAVAPPSTPCSPPRRST